MVGAITSESAAYCSRRLKAGQRMAHACHPA